MSGYDEAVAWFRADPERVRDLDDVDNRSAAIAIVNAVLAEAAPAGRDLTAQDELRRVSGWFGGAARKLLLDRANELDRIARPSGGVGQPDTAEPRIPTPAEIVDEYEASQRASTDLKTFPQVGDRARITTGASVGVVGTVSHFVAPVSWHLVEDDGGPIGWYSADELELPDRSPRSWSLPAPPPEVTEALGWTREHTTALDLLSGSTWSNPVMRHAATIVRWLLSVVEGEPPAPEPQAAEPRGYRKGFDDGVKYARDIDRTIARMTVPAAPVDEAHRYAEGYDPYETGSLLVDIRAAWLAGHRAALAAAGAERVEEEQA